MVRLVVQNVSDVSLNIQCLRSFDVSKQIIGQMFVHGLNVLISDIVSRLSSGNACVLYFLNILVDTTLGKSFLCLCAKNAHLTWKQGWHSSI